MKSKKVLFRGSLTFLIFIISTLWLTAFSSSPARAAQSDTLLGGTYYTVAEPPQGNDQYTSADYRLWLPPGVPTLRAVLFKQHGCGDTAADNGGLLSAQDFQWQSLALKYSMALMSSRIPLGPKSCETFSNPDNGTGNAFLRALNDFANQTGHAELVNVPWALWGHSGGSFWTAAMVEKYPQRVLAAVATRCGTIPTTETDAALFGIPVLWAVGAKDPVGYQGSCIDVPQATFTRYRAAGALWALAVEANAEHETGDTRYVAIPYFDAILPSRLPASGTTLRAVDQSQAWLGNPVTGEIAPVASYTGDALAASWLPDQTTAQKWQQYVQQGNVVPTQAPLTPIQVNVSRSGTTATIDWSYPPDLNGLPAFHVYRNGELIGTTERQGNEYLDAPYPAVVKLNYQDSSSSPADTYTVASFNAAGESARIGATAGAFTAGFENSESQPTWTNTVDTSGQPAGGSANVTGICCDLNGPEAGVRTNEVSHTGGSALLYSGLSTTNAGSAFAYTKVFDLSGRNIPVATNTTLSYWIYPQSSSSNTLVSGKNSSCVAIDLIFQDSQGNQSNLRDSGAVDQNGNRAIQSTSATS